MPPLAVLAAPSAAQLVRRRHLSTLATGRVGEQANGIG